MKDSDTCSGFTIETPARIRCACGRLFYVRKRQDRVWCKHCNNKGYITIENLSTPPFYKVYNIQKRKNTSKKHW